MIGILITIGVLILLALGLRALRRRFKVVDTIYWIILLIAFVWTWVVESFWWAIGIALIVFVLGMIFLGIGGATTVKRGKSEYTISECKNCGYEKYDIIDETESSVTVKCRRCGWVATGHLKGLNVENIESQPQREFSSHSQQSNDTDPYEEENRLREQKMHEREENRRARREEYERYMGEYESVMSEIRSLLDQADTLLDYANDHERKGREYNDEDHFRQAHDYRSTAEIYTNKARDLEGKAKYYYSLAQEYKD